MKRITFDEKHAHAMAAAKDVARRFCYVRNYVSGHRVISVREPDQHTIGLTRILSLDYAERAGVTLSAALRHLRRLAAAGVLTEDRRSSGPCSFRPYKSDAERVGREVIAELRAEGLPFEDEFRAERAKR